MNFTARQEELGGKVLGALRGYFSTSDFSSFALAYSGGLDSTLLLALCPGSVHPYTLGSENSRDFYNSAKGSEFLNFHVTKIPLDQVDLNSYVSLIKDIDPEIKKQDIGYELVLAAVLDRIQENNVITGQGADELFYGYHRFIEDREMTNDLYLEKLFSTTLPRERKIAEHFGKTLVTPYLDSGLQEILKSSVRDDHFSEGMNKALLRCAGIKMGLPRDYAELKKTAAQYGSGMMKQLKRTESWSRI